MYKHNAEPYPQLKNNLNDKIISFLESEMKKVIRLCIFGILAVI